jgi:hypothetical protein
MTTLVILDSPVPGETGFAFHGAGKPGNDVLGEYGIAHCAGNGDNFKVR